MKLWVKKFNAYHRKVHIAAAGRIWSDTKDEKAPCAGERKKERRLAPQQGKAQRKNC